MSNADKTALEKISAIYVHPNAHHKIMYCRANAPGNVEVAFFCITHPQDPMYVIDVEVAHTESTGASFDMEDFIPERTQLFDDLLEVYGDWSRFDRILCHTHPGNSASPSTVDDEDFNGKVNDHRPYYVQLIFADDDTFCRLSTRSVPGMRLDVTLPVKIYTQAMKEPEYEPLSPEDLNSLKEILEDRCIPLRYTYSTPKSPTAQTYSSGYSNYYGTGYDVYDEAADAATWTPKAELDDIVCNIADAYAKDDGYKMQEALREAHDLFKADQDYVEKKLLKMCNLDLDSAELACEIILRDFGDEIIDLPSDPSDPDFIEDLVDQLLEIYDESDQTLFNEYFTMFLQLDDEERAEADEYITRATSHWGNYALESVDALADLVYNSAEGAPA